MNFFRLIFFLTTPYFYLSIKYLSKFKSPNKIDVLFYYPHYYLESDSKYPSKLNLLIKSVKNNYLNSLVVEEPSIYSNSVRSKDAIPFDFIWILVIIFRKFYRGNDYDNIDVKIGKIFKKIFFRNVKIKNVITISQSFQSFFRGMFPSAKLFDYQHGLISSKYYGYIYNDEIAKHIIKNKINILLFGSEFKRKIIKVKGGEYFQKNSFVIGSNINIGKSKPRHYNRKILFTLQFTESHSFETNKMLYNKSTELFEQINNSKINVNIFLRKHPRHDKSININNFLKFNFIKIAPKELESCLNLCTLHITEYSSVLFNSINKGVPSILTNFTKELNIYQNEYKFPDNNLNLVEKLKMIEDSFFYDELINKQIKWSKKLYQEFNEKKFIELIT